MTQDEQITLYALGALDERERVEVERQLSASVNLRAQLAEELAMLHALGATVDLVVPSAAAKKRVMDRLIAVPVTPRRQIQKELPRRSSWLDTLRWLLSGLAVAASACTKRIPSCRRERLPSRRSATDCEILRPSARLRMTEWERPPCQTR